MNHNPKENYHNIKESKTLLKSLEFVLSIIDYLNVTVQMQIRKNRLK